MNTPMSALMQRQVESIGFEDTVERIEALFKSRGLSWAPVVEGGSVVLGVISAADLLRFHAEKRNPAEVQAWQLCTYKPIVVGPDTALEDVARLMLERHIHHVVVARGGSIEGVVSSLDFVRRCLGNSA